MKNSEKKSFIEFVYRPHERLENRILLIYEGEVNQDIIKAFTNLAQKNLDEDEEASIPIKKRAYHVMVECLQNVGKHSDTIESGEPENPGTGILMVIKSEAGYSIVTGNPIANKRIPEISSMLDKVNAMDAEQIKVYYKEKILASRISEKGGAGIGFIDIVKRTGNRLDYHFQEMNRLTSLFIVKTKIS